MLVWPQTQQTYCALFCSITKYYDRINKKEIMSITSNTAEVLNDLIKINNDRIEGYQKAIEQLESNDTDLNNLFTGFIVQSRELKSALESEVNTLGGEIEKGTTASGKIY